MLDVRRLRVLLAVAEHGGVSPAARALSFTPPAVSQQLAALERQLGVALVDRSQRTARLTAAGHRLAEHARQLIAGLEAAEADLAGMDDTVRGVLRVACVPTLGRALLPRAVVALRDSAPEIDLRIYEAEPEDSLPAVARGETDIAIAGEFSLAPRRAHANVDRVDLFAEPMLVAVPSDFRLRSKRIRLAQLRDERWIAPLAGSSCAALLNRSCALAGFEPHVVGRCGDFDMATALVASGVAITLVPRISARSTPGVRLLRATDPAPERTLYTAVRHGAREHPLVAAFSDALSSVVREHQ